MSIKFLGNFGKRKNIQKPENFNNDNVNSIDLETKRIIDSNNNEI